MKARLVNLAISGGCSRNAGNTGVTIAIYHGLTKSDYTVNYMFAALTIKEFFQENIPSLASAIHSAARRRDSTTPLQKIIQQRELGAQFQPILNLETGEFYGYEGLIRGPGGSEFNSPRNLFTAAAQQNLSLEVELLSRQIVLETFVQLNLPGNLFLNVSPDALLQPSRKNGCTLSFIKSLGLSPERVVIEITENQPTHDFTGMRNALLHYRAMGFQIAIDDLGEGFSSLRLWSELRPEFIKVDMHFVQGVDTDPIKMQFLESIQLIAESCGTRVIAEGIETRAELSTVRNIGIQLGQGYFMSRPASTPPLLASTDTLSIIHSNEADAFPKNACAPRGKTIAQKLLRRIEPVPPEAENDHILDRFSANPMLRSIPVVQHGTPVGLINRHHFIDSFAKPFQRELLGKKPCSLAMQKEPLLVDKSMPIEELGHYLADADERHFNNGFIITDHGRYLGVASGQDLLRQITEMQIDAARYANPLTLLPGNVPVNEHIEHLLQTGTPFYACCCNLDNFKPYNEVYSYRHGDEMIQLAGRILTQV